MRVDYPQLHLSAAAEAALLRRLFTEGWVPEGDGILQIDPFWDGDGMYRSICILVEEADTLDGPWRPVGAVYILDSGDIVQAVLEEEHLGKMPDQKSGARALFCAVKGLQDLGGSSTEALNKAVIEAMTDAARLPVRAEDEAEKGGAGECSQVPLPFWEMPPQ